MAFKEWQITETNTRVRIKDNQISINCSPHAKSPAYTLRLSSDLSEKVEEKGLKYLAISQEDITGQIAIVIRNSQENGLPLRISGRSKDSRGNLVASNKQLITRLAEELNIGEGVHTLTISPNKSKREEVMFFEIINPNEE